MSEHPPQNKKIDDLDTHKAPSDGREANVSVDHLIANHINENSNGEGASPELVDELYRRLDMSHDELSALAEKEPQDDNTSEALPETGNKTNEAAVDAARDEVEKAIDKDDLADKGDDEPAVDVTPEDEGGYSRRDPEAASRDYGLYEQIDAIDSIRNYKERTKKLREFALLNNGQLDSMGVDIGVEAAKRLDTSHARSIFNPRRYTLKLGSARRQYNGLLAEMAKGGPNGANLTAARAMKRNWDPRYAKNEHVPGKNEVIYNVAVLLERQIEDIPKKIEEASQELHDLLQKENPDQKKIESKQEEVENLHLKYNYSVEKAGDIESHVDPLFMGARKYYGEIVANRAIMQKDLAVLEKIDNFMYKKQREKAISEILIKLAGDIPEGTGQSPEEYKAGLLLYAKKHIANKKIRDATIKQIA